MESRRKKIIELLAIQPSYTYKDLMALLGVSSMTIRRDVDSLSERGMVIKELGGVRRINESPISFSLYETDLHSRLNENVAVKRGIGSKALELIEPGQNIFLDASSTCLEFAKILVSKFDEPLTVLTPSLLVSAELARKESISVVCCGGELDNASMSFVGPLAEDHLSQVYVDLAFVSTKSVMASDGTYESAIPTMREKQIIAKRSERLILLTDSSKFGRRALRRVLSIQDFWGVCTDANISPEDLEMLKTQGLKCFTASDQIDETERERIRVQTTLAATRQG